MLRYIENFFVDLYLKHYKKDIKRKTQKSNNTLKILTCSWLLWKCRCRRDKLSFQSLGRIWFILPNSAAFICFCLQLSYFSEKVGDLIRSFFCFSLQLVYALIALISTVSKSSQFNSDTISQNTQNISQCHNTQNISICAVSFISTKSECARNCNTTRIIQILLLLYKPITGTKQLFGKITKIIKTEKI